MDIHSMFNNSVTIFIKSIFRKFNPKMNTVIEVQLDWTYTPSNIFEEPIEISHEYYSLTASDGKALAKIHPEFYESNPAIRDELTEKLENKLRAVQITSHTQFTLGKPSRTDLRKDGNKNVFVEAQSLMIATSTMTADIVVLDQAGHIISSSKQERLDREAWFEEMIARYRKTDATLDQMLKSYEKAVDDKNNELVHLYEIRDALINRFGNRNKIIAAIDITCSDWNTLGRIANDLPLREGRHRGKSVGVLRPATEDELYKARSIALNLIENYLKHLEQQN